MSVPQLVQRWMSATRRQASALANQATGGGPVTSARTATSNIQTVTGATVTPRELSMKFVTKMTERASAKKDLEARDAIRYEWQ